MGVYIPANWIPNVSVYFCKPTPTPPPPNTFLFELIQHEQ